MITVEKIIRKHVKKNGIRLTKEEQDQLQASEAATVVKSTGKWWGLLKVAGALALIAGIWWWFKGRKTLLGIGKSVGASATDIPVDMPIAA